jgi:Type I phosphodiesterase / nucleotide pyrophosphatase
MMARRVLWHVWDAAAHWAVRRLLDEGDLPALRSVVGLGMLTAAEPSWPNAQTPTALATLFTGLDPADHGVTGFMTPDPSRGILGCRRGFASEALCAAPIWDRLDPERFDTMLVHVPWAVPEPDGPFPPGLRFAIDGYSRRVRRGGVVVLDGAPSDSEALPMESVAARKPTEDIVAIESLEGRRMPLRLDAGWQAWCPGTAPATLVRAVRRPSDGVPLLLQLGAWETTSAPDACARSAAQRTDPFVGEGLGRFYRRGVFGPTLLDGGDGGAERILLSTVEQAARYFTHISRVSLDVLGPASLTVVYQPCIDDLAHELTGLCDPASPVFDAGLATTAWRSLRAAYRWADAHLGALLRHADPETLVVVSSDHGMAGMSHDVYANAILERAGLLVFDCKGEIDPRRTQIALSPAADGSIWVNSIERPGGSVPRSRVEETVEHAERALTAVRESSSGRHVVSEVLCGRSRLRPELGDAYLVLAPGFHLETGPAPGPCAVVATRKTGGHLTNTGVPSLAGILAAAGPGLPAAWRDKSVNNRDVAPWLLSVLTASPQPPQGATEVGVAR